MVNITDNGCIGHAKRLIRNQPEDYHRLVDLVFINLLFLEAELSGHIIGNYHTIIGEDSQNTSHPMDQ